MKTVLLGNIGSIYNNIYEFSKALENYNKSINSFDNKSGNKNSLAGTYSNCGLILQNLKEYDSALIYFKKSSAIAKEANNKILIAKTFNSIGVTYLLLNKFDSANYYLNEGLNMRKSIKDFNGIQNSLINIANYHFKSENYNEAIIIAKKSFDFNNKFQEKHEILFAFKILYLSYEALNKTEDAYKMFKQFSNYKDSISITQDKKSILNIEFKYELDKQAYTDSIKNIEKEKVNQALLKAEQAETKKSQQQSYFLIVGLILAIIFRGFMYNRFKFIKEQRFLIIQ